MADSVLEKFNAAVPVFFSLCRRLRLSRLNVVYQLANALVFSLLYGCEFLRRVDVIEKCEATWWRGVRSFYGLPPGVSAPFVRLLFPQFSLVHRVLESKFSLLRRGTMPLPTLFPEAVIFDRGFLFSQRRKGFSQIVHDWCTFLGLTDLFFEYDRPAVRSRLIARKNALNDDDWRLFSVMDSTSFAASLFESRPALHSVLTEVSKFSKLGVRAVMLSLSGSLALSYDRSRLCICGGRLNCEHFLTCASLGSDLVPGLRLLVKAEDWSEVSVILLTRFYVYIHAIRGGELTAEENELFDRVFATPEVVTASAASLFD
jgi:hypothetical protein